jgi:hypothetical protein
MVYGPLAAKADKWNTDSNTLQISGVTSALLFLWRAPQQMLRTHRSLKAYCATLWCRRLLLFVFPNNGAPVEWNWQGKTEVLGEKPVPVPLCPPQIPHGLTPGSNPGLRGERPVTNRPSHGTAIFHSYLTLISTPLTFVAIKQETLFLYLWRTS